MDPEYLDLGWWHLGQNPMSLPGGTGMLDEGGYAQFEVTIDAIPEATPCKIWSCQAVVGNRYSNMVEVRFRE
jgi:hypothetical protein